MAVTREILGSHPASVLKKEISKTNIKGYSKMKKEELIELMMKNRERFGHIKMAEKKARATPDRQGSEARKALASAIAGSDKSARVRKTIKVKPTPAQKQKAVGLAQQLTGKTSAQLNQLDPAALFGLLPTNLRLQILDPKQTGVKVASPFNNLEGQLYVRKTKGSLRRREGFVFYKIVSQQGDTLTLQESNSFGDLGKDVVFTHSGKQKRYKLQKAQLIERIEAKEGMLVAPLKHFQGDSSENKTRTLVSVSKSKNYLLQIARSLLLEDKPLQIKIAKDFADHDEYRKRLPSDPEENVVKSTKIKFLLEDDKMVELPMKLKFTVIFKSGEGRNAYEPSDEKYHITNVQITPREEAEFNKLLGLPNMYLIKSSVQSGRKISFTQRKDGVGMNRDDYGKLLAGKEPLKFTTRL